MSVSDCSRFCMVIHDRLDHFLLFRSLQSVTVDCGKKTYSKGDEISCGNLRDSDAAICKCSREMFSGYVLHNLTLICYSN